MGTAARAARTDSLAVYTSHPRLAMPSTQTRPMARPQAGNAKIHSTPSRDDGVERRDKRAPKRNARCGGQMRWRSLSVLHARHRKGSPQEVMSSPRPMGATAKRWPSSTSALSRMVVLAREMSWPASRSSLATLSSSAGRWARRSHERHMSHERRSHEPTAYKHVVVRGLWCAHGGCKGRFGDELEAIKRNARCGGPARTPDIVKFALRSKYMRRRSLSVLHARHRDRVPSRDASGERCRC